MPDRQLTKAPRALNYRSGPLAIIGMRMDDITVTERAARQIGAILGREPPGTMLRVSVEGGGCSGFQYKFDMERSQAAEDVVITREGVTVLIDRISLGYLAGSEIDYVDDLIGASFKI